MIKYHFDLQQGSINWLKTRGGLLTASEMDRVLTPTLKVAANAASKTHLYDLLAQRITGEVEQGYENDAMIRGHLEEEVARVEYGKKYAPVTECGFVTNDNYGFVLGMSPDGLVGDDGLIEVKSRAPKYQVQTIVQNAAGDPPFVPLEFMLQIQTGLLITERKWCDFISICTGLNMVVIRVEPDPAYFQAILCAAAAFEHALNEAMEIYKDVVGRDDVTPITEKVRTEIY